MTIRIKIYDRLNSASGDWEEKQKPGKCTSQFLDGVIFEKPVVLHLLNRF